MSKFKIFQNSIRKFTNSNRNSNQSTLKLYSQSSILHSVVDSSIAPSIPTQIRAKSKPIIASRRKLILPFVDSSISPTVEEAVDNILYNNPSLKASPITRHTLNCLVSDEPGVLARISGILAGRGFNIQSLVVASTEVKGLSRMTIVLSGQDSTIDQAKKQLQDIVPVWAVLDYTHSKVIQRELLMVKVTVVPEGASCSIDDHGSDGEINYGNYSKNSFNNPLLASSLQRQSLTELCGLFEAKVVDVTLDDITIELCAKPSRVEAFINLLKPYGIIEVARSGVMAMPRSQLNQEQQQDSDNEEAQDGRLDATMLPPG